ncbi:TSSK6-activating co-chaperone protein isoform X2 [Mesocricetus auratus]|uniref:TSSK6-activating co-chaperone protein isoform X2 n=1 Tax=Mesocricetus auratus TaxID=10036 RepID=A0ABM2Y4F1_MESAU|nr:TSSK6-activating co-chaperone protein isoform X2 [Mesocricetus auratus]
MYTTCVPGARGGTIPVAVEMEQPTNPTNDQAKPSPSYINLQANSPPATFLNIQTTKLPSGAGQKPKECLGLLECMYANLQLQTQLAQQQMAILENLQASLSQLGPGRESNNGSLPALCCKLLFNHLPQFHK